MSHIDPGHITQIMCSIVINVLKQKKMVKEKTFIEGYLVKGSTSQKVYKSKGPQVKRVTSQKVHSQKVCKNVKV